MNPVEWEFDLALFVNNETRILWFLNYYLQMELDKNNG